MKTGELEILPGTVGRASRPDRPWEAPYRNCRLCPRACGVDRTRESNQSAGFCGMDHRLRVAYIGPHFGEEPPISGTRGSGTVFLSGCSLRCTYCQNHQISHGGMGVPMTIESLVSRVAHMFRTRRVHNLNWVTPDHFLPHVLETTRRLRGIGLQAPVVFNISGYQSLTALRRAEDMVDIFLADVKYADHRLAESLSGCRDYFARALDAVAEMHRMKGFLNANRTENGVATCGLLVRHLILPGHVQNSLDVLTGLFVELGPKTPLSIMSQYHPVRPQRIPSLNRPVHREEFEQVYEHARGLGFERLFVQFPEPGSPNSERPSPFLPDFRNAEPFGTTDADSFTGGTVPGMSQP